MNENSCTVNGVRYVVAPPVADEHECTGCVANNPATEHLCTEELLPPCGASDRLDGKNVIWLRDA